MTQITINNPSFEQPVLASGKWTEGGITPGWGGNTGGVWFPVVGTGIVAAPPDGNQVGWVDGSRPGTKMVQDTGTSIDGNAQYSLSVDVCPPVGEACKLTVAIIAYPSEATIASQDVTFTGTEAWQTINVSGQAIGVGTVGIKFSASQGQPNFDNVQLSSSEVLTGGNPYSTLPVGVQTSCKVALQGILNTANFTPGMQGNAFDIWTYNDGTYNFQMFPGHGTPLPNVQSSAGYTVGALYLNANALPFVTNYGQYNTDVQQFLANVIVNQMGLPMVPGL